MHVRFVNVGSDWPCQFEIDDVAHRAEWVTDKGLNIWTPSKHMYLIEILATDRLLISNVGKRQVVAEIRAVGFFGLPHLLMEGRPPTKFWRALGELGITLKTTEAEIKSPTDDLIAITVAGLFVKSRVGD